MSVSDVKSETSHLFFKFGPSPCIFHSFQLSVIFLELPLIHLTWKHLSYSTGEKVFFLSRGVGLQLAIFVILSQGLREFISPILIAKIMNFLKVVTHPMSDLAQCCLTSEIGSEVC